ncbi:MAG: 23S rRNA (uracil(1939)-C(5))-methyltransferase RlmD [Firmicutes bacterium]|jgi:23S rRNA (uracil1939-C5)-methyltransferase|nr:23S rRNA (uracil(1939)-C(5))-methyltransferase RlmD [Bacillota bacterium]
MAAKKHKQPSVTVGQQTELEITGLGHAGEGVGRVNDFAIFVPGTIPGDQILAKIQEVKRNHGRASIIKVIRSAAGRVAPECVVAGDCGGCQLQHMAYESQLEWKRQLVVDALTRIGKFEEPLVQPVIGMAHPCGYRNKVQYPMGLVGGKVALGFYRRGTHAIVPIEECANTHPLCNKALQVVSYLLAEIGLVPYDEITGDGLIRHLVCRVSTAHNQLMVILVTNGKEVSGMAKLVEKMRAALPELVTVAQNVNTKRTNVIMGEKTRILWGAPYLIEELNGLKFAISPRSFFQVNSEQAAILCHKVVEYAKIGQRTRALDCYSGTGSIALHLAREGAHVIGIEVVPEAIGDAKLNAELNHISGAEFRVGRVESELPGILEEGSVDMAVLDPPRKGCESEVLGALLQAKIPRLVYVSCNPSSLARDLAILAEGGYELREVQPVDMFPQTSHVECVVLMSTRSPRRIF